MTSGNVQPLHFPLCFDMRKHYFVAWEQQRRRPACTCVQSDQCHCYSLSGKNQPLKMGRNARKLTLAFLTRYDLKQPAQLQRKLEFLHTLEKYLNVECSLEKSLKIKSALKRTGKSLKSLEKSLYSTIFCRTAQLMET